MPRQKPFDKRTATTYALLHRPQHDPLIHDENASAHVFSEISGPSISTTRNRKVKQRGDLEEEFGPGGSVRANEGEAAEHGIFYDDSDYDYMQHMRELGGGSQATWVEAPQPRQKGKNKQTLEDALSSIDLGGDDAMSLGGLSFADSRASRATWGKKQTYQNQQDVPDELAGFQPDMDPRLREVLEALDDEAYVDDEDDIFAELAGERAEEVDPDEFERTLFDDDDDEGWQSDDTTKPSKEYNTFPLPPDADAPRDLPSGMPDPHAAAPDLSAATAPLPASKADGEWLASYTKSKLPNPASPSSIAPSSILSTTPSALTGRRKKRKGALTSSTSFSMTSSALARTEPLTLLDSRFDRLAESYMDDLPEDDDEFDDAASVVTATTNRTAASNMSSMSRVSRASQWSTTSSQAPALMPAGFDNVMDEFLGTKGTGTTKGRKMKKVGREGVFGQQTGMQQLDEIRGGLGPARMKGLSS